ncbi:SdrD B-like domain-containing protein [Amycolatopsis coloradensis]|uniref:SdrD B-like domain-containing protein n=1 Tax=Amycolatopsis coloradensis TaxID=76021 RepID=A0ACD5BRS4_9PSEU
MRRTSLRTLGVLTAAFTLAGLATATPASAEPGPNLKVTATVVQGRYLPGDEIPVDVTITNLGDVPATEVRGNNYTVSGPYFTVPRGAWGDLANEGPGASFAPGETRTYRVVGKSMYGSKEDPAVQFEVYTPGDVDYRDNTSIVTLEHVPTGTTDRVAGQLYGDANEDGMPSPGEGLAGAEVHLNGVGMTGELITTTDSAGRFEFAAIPVTPSAGIYFSKVPGDWVAPYIGDLRVDGSGSQAALEIKATRPLTDVLQASGSLDKASYAVGETAKATLVLTNVGDRPLADLWVGCDPMGNGQHLEIADSQWGDFSPMKQAGALAAGQRLEITVTGRVPEKASYFGNVHLTCYVEGKTAFSGPVADAEGKVPGKRADSRGRLWTDKNGNGQWDSGEQVPNVTATLSTDGGKLVSLARTDAEGWVTFPNVAVGVYRLRAVAPWRAVGDTDVHVIAPPYGFGDWHQQVVRR